MRFHLIAHAAVASCLASAAAADTTTVGAIPGQFSVSETGAATYTIPIQVPPGIAGLEPKLALTYNSQGGNGLLGVGWSLTGLSAITRCPRTISQDGARAGIEYSSNDRYCLDGQRLVATTGTYGAVGTEYRTELESFTKIISYGMAGNGPAWFKVWTKSGQIVEYGNTADSRVEAQGKTSVAVWAVNRISDTKGNYLTVTYTEDTPNGQYYPTRIDYTGNANAAQAPANSIQFVYETRPDTNPQYVGGSLVRLTQRLIELRAFRGSAALLAYQLLYQNSPPPNNASRVTQVQVCGQACLPATVFSWQPPDGSGAFSLEAWSVPFNLNGGLNHLWADVNGDGRDDLISGGGAFGGTAVAYSTGAGFQPAASVGRYNWCGWECTDPPVLVGDLNGDGRADFFHAAGWNGNPGNTVMLSTSTGFTPTAWANSQVAGSMVGNGKLADVNGDGQADLIYTGGMGGTLVAYSTGGGFQPAVLVGTYNWCGWECTDPPVLVGDMNGDGRADLLHAAGWSGYPAKLLLIGKASAPDLVIGITNGLGAHAQIDYAPLANAAYYTPASGSVFPLRDLPTTAPLHLVSNVSTDNGIGGQSSVSYGYAVAKAHLHGRGFLGFRVVAARDEQTGITTTTEYRQDYPYIGLPSRTTKTTSGGTLIHEQDTLYAAQALGGTRYFPYAAQSVENRYDLDGSLMVSATTTNQYDAYGNATQISVTSHDGYSKVTTNQYDNDPVNWILGRLRRATVTSTTPTP